jgi:hypothetical protein
MIVKDLNNEKKVLSYLSTTESVYNDLLLVELKGKKYALLVKVSGKNNSISNSAVNLEDRGFGDLKVLETDDYFELIKKSKN